MNYLAASNRSNRIVKRMISSSIFIILLTGCGSLSAQSARVSTSVPIEVPTSDASVQVYVNQQEGYSIAIPKTWSITTSDIGTAYFLSPEGERLRSNGLTDWEASVAGIQLVGRNEQLSENEQYEAILPNHCSVGGWTASDVDSVAGRKYSLDCDNVSSNGTHKEEHIYIPRGKQFVELYLKMEPASSEQPVPSIDNLASDFHLSVPKR